jgi:integrase
MAKRNANGEGSISQRKDGRWMASVSLGDGTRKHFLGHSWADAHALMVAFQKSQQDGVPVITERQTVRQYLLAWQESTASSRKPRTNVRYEELVRVHVLPAIGQTQLTKLTTQQLQSIYAGLGKKLAPSTVRQVHAILHKALRQAAQWGSIVRDPAAYLEAPRVPRVETQVLSSVQVRAFLDAAAGSRFEALFVLAVTSGMREGELLGLRWCDVNLDEGVLQVRHQMQRLNSKWGFVEPKSAKSRRTIVLNSMAVEALHRHRAKQAAERLRNGPYWEDWDLVFANELGKPMEVSNLTHRYFRPLLKRAGLPQIRVHDLRHSAATLMLGANVNVKIVSEMLGHSQTAFTMDRYQHVSREMQRDAMTAVEAALR